MPRIKTFDLYQNGIVEIGEQFFHNVTNVRELFLQGNMMSSVPSDSLSVLLKLSYLDLSSNRILEIPANCFMRNTELQKLMLYGNSIRRIQNDAFRELSRLEILNLSSNNMTTVIDLSDDMVHLMLLSHLVIDQNKIVYLNSSHYNCPSLINLSGKHNELTVLARYSLVGFPELKTLYLQNNRISFVHELAFGSSPHGLEFLLLEANQLRDIPVGLLKMLIALKVLVLRSNFISTVPALAFERNHLLRSINLADNLIHVCDTASLTGLLNLEHLDLGQNKLSDLPPEFLDPEKDFFLSLRGNGWTCDCSALPLYNWALKSRFYVEKLTCQGPMVLQNRSLWEIPALELCNETDIYTTLSSHTFDIVTSTTVTDVELNI
ncbi:leucine-rich repeat transmembrane protein FLRT2-like [Apostichopus japonicus]|uniref:leucine-rich repeat transmembrane protein FLRT2-like n=1 Tax=Stichopus japonicus TaxID=307972 RepID=UPI003AB1B4B5